MRRKLGRGLKAVLIGAARSLCAPAIEIVSNSMSDRPVVTRIAPSPTGSMHIGTARTALFNWLYAKHTGGKFLLRIEDTDRERSTEAAVQVIFDGLAWLGLTPDAEPVFQFARADRHREVVAEMLARGGAYRCYMTPDELEIEREAARAEGSVIRDIWVLRMRAMLARACGDDAGYRELRDRYREMATSLGFEGHMQWAAEMP